MKKSAKSQAGDRKKTPAELHKDEVRKITEENRKYQAKLEEEQPLAQITFAPSLRNAATFLNNPNHPSSVKLDENRVEKTPDFKTKWKTTCQHCRGLLEFAAADAGKQTDCPYCSKEISLQQNPPTPFKVLILKYRSQIAAALGKLSSIFWLCFFGCLVVICFVDVAHAPRLFLVSFPIVCVLSVLLGFACQLAASCVSGEEQHVGNDPSSLQYAGWNSSKLGNGDVDVVVQYRAKNGFGALTLHRGDFVLSPDGTILRANPDMDAP